MSKKEYRHNSSGRNFIIGAVFVFIGFIVFAGIYNRSRGTTSGVGAIPGPHGGARPSANYQATAGGGVLQKNSAPDFSLAKLGGGTITLSEFRGKKPVVVDFWASWCPNCRRDMPNLSRFYEKYKDKVEVIGVNLKENEGTVRDFISSRGISFPIALDPYSQAANAFGIQYTNTHFLINKEGTLTRTIPGDIQESDIQTLIQSN